MKPTAHLHDYLSQVYAGKTVWLSGHTGFKGAWLALWLHELGAEVHGFALEAEEPSLYKQAHVARCVHETFADVRDASAVRDSIAKTQPDYIFHLAAQPLVRQAYREPVSTWETNVLGTIHVLEALRELETTASAIFITTDKVYENREWDHGYREEDALGGHDPYSSSKGAAELAIASWRKSFFQDHPVRIASARAGNVIGGGDWAIDRIVPDAMRALAAGEPVGVRNPQSTRPWQHVLEPLSGYLLLGARLASDPQLAEAFNFGPTLDSNRRVSVLVEELLCHWPGTWRDESRSDAPHEAGKLNLATDKAFHRLGWQPRWDFAATVARTVQWYRGVHEGANAAELTLRQIAEYSERCGKSNTKDLK